MGNNIEDYVKLLEEQNEELRTNLENVEKEKIIFRELLDAAINNIIKYRKKGNDYTPNTQKVKKTKAIERRS